MKEIRSSMMKSVLPLLAAATLIGAGAASAQDYDIVLKGGRVMDPATSLDAAMNVGIKAARSPR